MVLTPSVAISKNGTLILANLSQQSIVGVSLFVFCETYRILAPIEYEPHT